MPYRICKSFEVESGHMLSKHPDKCRFPHGHSRKIELVLEAAALDGNDMVCDFKAVKAVIGEYLAQFDHAMCMNVADPMFGEMKKRYGEQIIGFEQVDPTTEVLAKTVCDCLQARLADPSFLACTPYPVRTDVRVVRVRVWETSSSWAEYTPGAGGLGDLD
jgi:6-pyruvoyltetrahydropterin/6-carboxytetrahydropterin synthase